MLLCSGCRGCTQASRQGMQLFRYHSWGWTHNVLGHARRPQQKESQEVSGCDGWNGTEAEWPSCLIWPFCLPCSKPQKETYVQYLYQVVRVILFVCGLLYSSGRHNPDQESLLSQGCDTRHCSSAVSFMTTKRRLLRRSCYLSVYMILVLGCNC